MEWLIFAWSRKIILDNIFDTWRDIRLFLKKVINHFEKFYKNGIKYKINFIKII